MAGVVSRDGAGDSRLDGGRAIDWSRTSADYASHRPGPPARLYDLLAALGVGATGQRVLDLGTGTGLVARELARRGSVVSGIDVAAGQIAAARESAAGEGLALDFVVAAAEAVPFADASFDAVACRIAPHHFPDALAAVKEMARVARDRVVICDNTFTSESAEEADRLRDPSHVRNYGVPEWHTFFELAGLEVADEAFMVRDTDFEDWLARTETPDDVRPRVRELLDSRLRDGRLELPTVVLKGAKR